MYFPSALFVVLKWGAFVFLLNISLIYQTKADEPELRVAVLADKVDEAPALLAMLNKNGFDAVQIAQKDLDEMISAIEADENPLNAYDAVIMYIHSVLKPDVEQAIISYTQSGGRMLVVHHGLASAKCRNPDYMEFLGMKIDTSPDSNRRWLVTAEIPHVMVNLAPGHFITTEGIDYGEEKIEYVSPDREELRGEFASFSLPNTEIFHNQMFTDGREKTVLFGYRWENPDTGNVMMEDTSGWTKPVGEGLLIYLQAGHADHDFENPNYGQVIRNALVWEADEQEAE
jgi:hypothetical protein